MEAIALPRETGSSYGAWNLSRPTLTHQPYYPVSLQQFKTTQQTISAINQLVLKIPLMQMLTRPIQLKQISRVQSPGLYQGIYNTTLATQSLLWTLLICAVMPLVPPRHLVSNLTSYTITSLRRGQTEDMTASRYPSDSTLYLRRLASLTTKHSGGWRPSPEDKLKQPNS